MSYRLVPPEAWGYGEPSKGLMQTIPMSFHTAAPSDPLANMTAAVNYVRTEYHGDWNEEMVVRPRQAGKVTAIEKAMEIAKEAGFATGGIVHSPTGRLPRVRLSPGEFVMTPEVARAAADRALARMTGDYYTPEERAAMDEAIRAVLDEPPDDYPEPPQLPCW